MTVAWWRVKNSRINNSCTVFANEFSCMYLLDALIDAYTCPMPAYYQTLFLFVLTKVINFNFMSSEILEPHVTRFLHMLFTTRKHFFKAGQLTTKPLQDQASFWPYVHFGSLSLGRFRIVPSFFYSKMIEVIVVQGTIQTWFYSCAPINALPEFYNEDPHTLKKQTCLKNWVNVASGLLMNFYFLNVHTYRHCVQTQRAYVNCLG